MRRLLIALTSLSVVAAMVAMATPAGAAFPGANGKIVFAFASSDVNDTNEIYVMNSDGTDRTRLTNNSAADYYPAISPDGSKIAFASLRDGNPEIYVMNLDGGGQTRLTSNSWIDFSPAWSPDGSKIAFGSTRDGNYEIYVMNADGTGQTNLTNNGAEDQSAVWSPDGAKIAFDSTRNGNRDVFTMNPDGTGQTNMTNTPGFDENPDWSPDASKIAFDSFRDGNYEVYSMNADGTGQTRLTSDPSYDLWSVWSPDGTKMAFASGRDGNTEIYTMNPDGTGQTRVTNNSTSDFYLDWQPLPLDSNPPQTTITSAPHGTTGDHLPVFTFDSSEPGSTFECRLDSDVEARFVPCTSPRTVAWRWNGQHTFDVRATDGAGNVDPSPASETFTVATPPNGILGWGSLGPPPFGTDYVAIAAGGYTGSPQHALALRTNGTLVGWGDVGAPPAGNDYVAIAAGNQHGTALRSDGSLVGWGDNTYGQATPPAGTGFVAISAGQWHSLALRSDGSIVGWGNNGGGQLNLPGGNDYVAISAGLYHGVALKADGSIVGWGHNVFGQSTPPAGNDYVAISAGSWHSLALKTDGSIVAWGYNFAGQASPPGGNDYIEIAGGYYHSLALKADGSVVGWGYNSNGQANPPAGNGHVAIAAGGLHSLALGPTEPPPTISGDLSCNSVNGNGFASNSSVSVVVKDGPGGTTVFNNSSVPTDGTGNFNLFCGFGPDLVPGMEITVSGGSTTKVLVLADLTIDAVDPATDMVSGTAPPNSSVFVGVNNPPGPGGAGVNTTADGSGNWSVDFTGTFDITGGTHANASVMDADGDSTFVNKAPASISGDLSCNSVNGNGFASNSSVSVVVKDGPGGTTVFTNPSVPTDGTGNFNLFCGFGPDLVPGMEITVSDGSTTKVLVLADLTIDAVDPATDEVSGTAPPGAQLNVGVNNPPSGGGANLTVTADGTGNWSVDFTGTFDITAGTNANAFVTDADGDTTNFNRQAPSINGNISDDFIGGEGFEPSATVTVEVRDAPGGTLVFTGSSPTDGGGSFGLCCGPEVGLPDLVPGMEITVSDGSSTKVLVLAAITIDALDPASDVVSGTAPANSSLFVGVNNSSNEAGLNTTADGSGNWSVDFTGAFDIDATTQAQAHVFDNDGDATSAQKRPPTIHASYCCLGNIRGDDFSRNSSVTLEIFDSPGGTLVHSETIATDRFGSFDFNLESTGITLAAGMQVVATDNSTSDAKQLTLVPLTFDALNPSADIASGTAAPGTTIFVEIFADPSASLEVVADGSGSWLADFGAIGFDITSAMGAVASVSDVDGDTTDDEVFPPTISGNLLSDHVSGSDFTPNSSVDVEIFESSGGTLLFFGSVATGGEFGDFELGFETHGVDLVPGSHIVVTDGVTSATKELTLVSLTFDFLDPALDTAAGTASPGAMVFLEVFDSGGEFSGQTTADGSGAWSVDLGAEGFDVVSGGGNATVSDEDGDGTVADRGVPTFSATLGTDEVGGYSFTNSSTVTVEIFESPGGTLLFSGSAPVGSDSTFSVGSGTHGVNLAPGMHITVMDDTTSITKQLTLVLVTFDVLDPVDDVASGTAPPGMPLGLQFPDGGGETAPADENGDWFADLGAGGGDVTPDVRATICAVDADGDCTAAEYVPEADLLMLKTDPPGRQPTARNMTYTLTVSNVGPKTAYEATATDGLPSSVTFVSATPTQGSCSHSSGTVTCNLGTIASGATVTIAIVVRPTVPGNIVNTASVGASTPDPNSNNNVDAENTSICRITSRRSSIPCG